MDRAGEPPRQGLGRPLPGRATESERRRVGKRKVVDLHRWRTNWIGHPARPGPWHYEARYFLEDSYQSSASSAPATVTTTAPEATSGDVVRFLEQSTFGPTTSLIAPRSEHRPREFPRRAVQRSDVELSRHCRCIRRHGINVACPNDSTCQRDNYTMYPLQNRFFVNALYGPDQLRQRVAFALHQIIVVSGVDVTQPSWMAPYLQILDRNAFGNLPSAALRDLRCNPAMGNYLDINGNTRTQPERELRARDPAAVLDRHGAAESGWHIATRWRRDSRSRPTRRTMVNNFARVFTGWRLATAPAPGVPNYIDPMVANEAQHDVGAKTLLNGVVLPSRAEHRQGSERRDRQHLQSIRTSGRSSRSSSFSIW